ncbi:unnamed protein product [Polarella glacialis]|uniref:Uncharacterized protein n=1 Tax=Polarella glacialis TaxID=89957 RepID=A0A813KXV9_POLGL|nr:unnamed protein product [Polarella glacialis]CAE8710869.1 unnamed protein product [Polarella glacialis]
MKADSAEAWFQWSQTVSTDCSPDDVQNVPDSQESGWDEEQWEEEWEGEWKEELQPEEVEQQLQEQLELQPLHTPSSSSQPVTSPELLLTKSQHPSPATVASASALVDSETAARFSFSTVSSRPETTEARPGLAVLRTRARDAARTALQGGSEAAQAFSEDNKELQLSGARVRACLARFVLGIPVDLQELARVAPNTEVNPRGFVVIRSLRKPGWTGVINAKGVVKFFTAMDIEASRLAGKKMARMIQRRYSASAGFKHWRVGNVSALANVSFRIDVEGLASSASTVDGLRVVQQSRDSINLEVGEQKIVVAIFATGRLQVYKSAEFAAALGAMEALLPLLRGSGMWW